jgi:hypothetical protein
LCSRGWAESLAAGLLRAREQHKCRNHPGPQTSALRWGRRPKQFTSPSFEIPGDLVVCRGAWQRREKVGAKSIRGDCHELFALESVDLFFLFSGAAMIPRRSGRRVGLVVGGTRGKRPWPAGSRDWDPPASSHDGRSCGGPARPRILTAHGFEIAFLDARCGWSCPLKLKIRHHAAVGRWIFAATDRSGLGPLGAPPARRFEWKFLGQLVGLQNVTRVNVRPAAWR